MPLRMLACLMALSAGYGWSQTASAATAVAQMKYAPATNFASADDQRFNLVAGEIELGDDCNPLPLAAAAARAHEDTLVLARADTDKKSARASKAAPTTLIDAAPSVSPAAIGIAADGSRDWDIIVSDRTLNATMARWAATAGWQLLWELPVDYAVEARTQVHGTFEEAVSIVARSMESAEIPMKAVFYQGNKVLRIMAKGSE